MDSPPKRRRWWLTAIKVAVFVVLAWCVRGQIMTGIDEVRAKSITIEWSWLAVAGVLYLAGQLPSGFYWWRVLNRLGQQANLGETLRAYYVGSLGKYVPGKALVVILRAGLIRNHRVDTAVAAVSVFIETLTMMAVGAALSAVILAIQFRENWKLLALSVAFAVVAGVPTLPPVFRAIVRLLRVGRASPTAVQALDHLTYRTLAVGWLANVAGWFVMGASQWATLRAIGLSDIDLWTNWPLLTTSLALAVVVGFASLIPGGVGVREFVQLETLRMLSLDPGEALPVVVLFRLMTLVADLGLSAILYAAFRRRGETMPSPQ